MMKPRFFVLFLVLYYASEAYCMKCEGPLGIEISCPTMFNDNDKAFCCQSSGNIPYCCNMGEYIQNNTAIIVGILVGALILLIIITLCCCCFCSCCLLARRRSQPGRVIYAPVTVQAAPPPVYSASPYPPQPPTAVNVPPAYSSDYQPPINPNFKG